WVFRSGGGGAGQQLPLLHLCRVRLLRICLLQPFRAPTAFVDRWADVCGLCDLHLLHGTIQAAGRRGGHRAWHRCRAVLDGARVADDGLCDAQLKRTLNCSLLGHLQLGRRRGWAAPVCAELPDDRRQREPNFVLYVRM
ncbi:unnamed protein product, partial [Symbiodinium sp. CCMP2456]